MSTQNADSWTWERHGEDWTLVACDGSVRAAVWVRPRGTWNWAAWDEDGHCLGAGKCGCEPSRFSQYVATVNAIGYFAYDEAAWQARKAAKYAEQAAVQ